MRSSRMIAKLLRSTDWVTVILSVLTFLVFVSLFVDDETTPLTLPVTESPVDTRSRRTAMEEEKGWPTWAVEQKGSREDIPQPTRVYKPPPSKPALSLPMDDVVKHIESLRKIRNMSGEDKGEKLFADQYLTSLLEDDFRPIPMSKTHNNRLVLNPAIAKIPNVAHLIYFNDQHRHDWSGYFSFVRYVTFKSVEKYMKPGLILFWGDHVPWGSEWWKRTLHEVPNIYYVFAPPVFRLKDQIVEFIQHKSDWLRLDFLNRYGGIYLDNDVIVLRSFSDLMNHTMVMGQDTSNWRGTGPTMGSGVILCEKGAKFIGEWLRVFKRIYSADSYNLMSNRIPYIIIKHLSPYDTTDGKLFFQIKVLPGNFTDPYPKSEGKYILYCGHYDLQYNYAVHMYQEKEHVVPRDFKELEGYDCTLGDAMRIALYGDPKLLDTTNVTTGCKP